MFDNLIDLITEGLELSQKDTDLFNKVKLSPSLDYFSEEEESKNPNDPERSFDKASLLRLIQTAFIISDIGDHPHKKICQEFVTACDKANLLEKLLTQYSKFPRIVLIETLIIAGQKLSYIDKEEYINSLLDCTESAPAHIKALFAFCALQWTKVDKVYLNKGVKAPKNIWGEDSSKMTAMTKRNDLDDLIFTPLIFASYMSADGAKMLNSCLRAFDVFAIMKDQWIKSAKTLLNKEALSICVNHVYYLVMLYLKLFKSCTGVQLEKRIFPLISECVNREPLLYNDLIKNINFFQMQHMYNYSFDSIILLAGACCNSSVNALDILQKLKLSETSMKLIKEYFRDLKNSLAEVILVEPTDNAIKCLRLLQRFCKFLPVSNLKQLIFSFVAFKDDFEEGMEIQAFFAFITEFLENEYFSKYAAKILKYTTAVFPNEAHDFIESAMSNQRLSPIKLTKIMDISAENVISFSTIASTLISNHFTINKVSETMPQFVIFIATKYFPESVFKKFQTHELRWNALKLLIRVSHDLCICSPKYAKIIQDDGPFVRSLVSFIIAASNLLQKPQIPLPESNLSRFDNDSKIPAIEFLTYALSLLERLILINLTESDKDSVLTHSFFNENNEIFSTFVSLLELKENFTSQIRRQAVKILDLMCAVAARMNSLSVDAFYPKQRQRVLVESAKVNLFHATNIEQTINELDFISSTLNTQSAFSYSFVRLIGASYVSAAVAKLNEIKKESPELLRSVALLLSQVWRKLNAKSSVIKQITENTKFWPSVEGIITDKTLPSDYTDASNVIVSKAYFLRCKVCSDEQITPTLVKTAIEQVISYLPEKTKPFNLDFSINMKTFTIPAIHRTYGNNFYIDTDLLRRFLVTESNVDEIVGYAQELNRKMSRIDACTQLIQAIYALLCSRTKYEKEDLMPEIDPIIELVMKVIEDPLSPSSMILVSFKLLEFCLLNKKGIGFDISISNIKSIMEFIKNHPLEDAFHTLTYFFSIGDTPSSITEPMKEAFNACLNFAVEKKSENAIHCAQEMALSLRGQDCWIMNSIDELNNAAESLIATKLGTEFIHLLTVVCQNDANSSFLIESEFFAPFILNALPCAEKWTDPFWPAIFDLMAILPQAADIPYRFASKNMAQIVQFCLAEQIKGLTTKDLMRVKCSATSLIVSIFRESHRTGNDVTALEDKFKEIMIVVLKTSYNKVRSQPRVNLSGRIEASEDRNDKLSSVINLQNALMFLNMMDGYPQDLDVVNYVESKLQHSSTEFMVEIMELIQSLAEKKANNSYLPLLSRTFGLALRIYFMRIHLISEFHTSKISILEKNDKVDGKFRQIRTRAVRSIGSLINEAAAVKLVEDANFFEKVKLCLLSIK